MRRSRGWIFSFLALLFLLSGCTEHNAAPLPQLVIGCDDYRPYVYIDEDGEPAGLDVELAQQACSRMGYTAVFRFIDWQRRDEELQAGRVDCLWSCFAMDGQEEQYEWVGPYMISRQVVAVRKDSPIVSLKDLEGKKVAVRTGAKAEKVLLEQVEGNTPQVSSVLSLMEMDEVVTALRNDYVDACAGYAAALREQLQLAQVEYRFLNDALTQAKLGVAFAKDSDQNLRDALSQALSQMLADGTLARTMQGYGVDTIKALGGLTP